MTVAPDRLVGVELANGKKKTIILGNGLSLNNNTLEILGDTDFEMDNGEVGAIALGDAVYKTAVNDEVKLADASLLSTAEVVGLVAQASIAGAANGRIRGFGELLGAGIGTAGQDQWLSLVGTTGNTLSATPPTADDEVQINLGKRKNAADMLINIGEPLEV